MSLTIEKLLNDLIIEIKKARADFEAGRIDTKVLLETIASNSLPSQAKQPCDNCPDAKCAGCPTKSKRKGK